MTPIKMESRRKRRSSRAGAASSCSTRVTAVFWSAGVWVEMAVRLLFGFAERD